MPSKMPSSADQNSVSEAQEISSESFAELLTDPSAYRFDSSAILMSAGMAESVSGKLASTSVLLGEIEYHLPQGIEFFATLSNVGDAIILTGKASAKIDGTCSRCLNKASIDIETQLEAYYALSENSDLEGLEEDEYDFLPEDGIIDLSDAILSSVLVEIPMIFLCKDDCQGLCPRCGSNLNEHDCHCSELLDEFSPFAVLKDFFAD